VAFDEPGEDVERDVRLTDGSLVVKLKTGALGIFG
jgi:hypothetical protein